MSTSAMETSKPAQPATKKPIADLRALLEKTKDQIAVALPRHLSPERMIRVALTAVQKTPKLMECDALSIVGAVVQASQLGLEPDGVLGQAYLVPFWNSKTGRNEAQLQIGYRGFISLARRSGDIQSLSAHVVYKEDHFEYSFGLNEKLDHVPAEMEERGDPTHAWALVRFKDGGYQFDVMTAAEIHKVRQTSKAKDNGPWVSHWSEMAKKTVIRRLAKLLPMSVEDSALVKAAVLDEYADSGIAQNLAGEIDPASEAARIGTERKTQSIVNKYTPEVESQENGHDPAEESQEVHEPTMAESLAAMQERVDEAQRQANETGESVKIEFLGRPMVIDPETQPDPQQTPVEQTSAQPLASGKEHESQPSAKSGGSRRNSKPEIQGLPGVFEKP